MKHLSQRALIAGAIELKGDEEDATSLVTKAIEDLTKTVDDRLKAVEEKGADGKLIERLDKIEAKVNRPGGGGDTTQDKEATAAQLKAFVSYIRKGGQPSDMDLKVLTVADDARAGYLAPPETSTEVIRDITEFSPIRQYASVRQSNAPSVLYPVRTGITNAQWEGEIEESQESDVTFGQTEIVSNRLTTFVDVSNSLLLGSDGAVEQEVRAAFAEDFGKKESAAFVNGDGVKKPLGIMADPRIPVVANGSTTVLSTDALITLMYALPAAYRNRGVWLLNGSSLATLRKLKGSDGQYIWQPSLAAGTPETILGRPVAEAVDMEDATANLFPIAFGDLGTGYRIVDRVQLAVLSDPYTQARKGITRIHGTRWVGGGVVQPNAIRKLKMAVSL